MKSCPRCRRQYPDSEDFCDIDGTALVASAGAPAGRGTTVMPAQTDASAESSLECPVCGGRAQPGETVCNFCGTRLVEETQDPPRKPIPPPASAGRRQSSGFTEEQLGPREFGDEPAYEAIRNEPEERSTLSLVGFAIAALVALAAGAWLALYLGHRSQSRPLAQSSPVSSPAPASAAPVVELASAMPIQVQGDLAGALERDRESLRKTFEDNKAGIASAYKDALGADNSMSDGMVVRLHILPDGRVDNGAVRVSTSTNPSFDAEVIESMVSWKFAPVKGSGVTVDYPMIFAPAAGGATAVESDLNTKLASLAPDEPPEYAFAPSTPAGSPAAAATPPLAMGTPPSGAVPSPEIAGVPALPGGAASDSTPAVAAVPPPAPFVEATAPAIAPTPSAPRHRRRPPREMAALPPPKPPLLERVNEQLRASRKLRRVQAYTNGSVVTIFGKVFDKDDRLMAERTVRRVDGVSAVINNVTTDTQQWAQNEALIRQALQNGGLTGVNVKVIGSDAYLSGQVKTQLDRERAATIAEAAAPIRVRENLITVAIGNMFGF
ncbi:MAG TPA: TonB family protein [Candidatus Binataceae bacterium]|nr:TonB family protein [Candidatus Binataceae bacterium]